MNTNTNHTRRRRLLMTGASLVIGGAIALTTLGSSQADTTSQAPTVTTNPAAPAIAEPGPPIATPEPRIWSPAVTAYASAGAAADVAATQAQLRRAEVTAGTDSTKARAVPNPDGSSGSWTVVPAINRTCVILGAAHVLCGDDDRLAAAGAAVSWSVPSPDQIAAGSGTYAFRGVAVDEVDAISVINSAGDIVAKTTPHDSVFAVSVPAGAKPVGLRITGAGGKVSVIQVT